MATVSDSLKGGGALGPALRRRHRRDRGMTLLLTALMIGIGALLVWILAYVAVRGVHALDWGFLTDTPPGNPSDAGGGFYNGIIGSLEIVGIATLIAVPLGIGCAIYLNQYATGRVAAVLRLVTDVMLGIPTIVTGAFVYALWVVEFGFSGYAGAFALGLVMVPLIVRATEEMLRLVPRDIHEASLALGATQSRTIVSVLLPTARAGIITGVMLAIARAMGETAPLLLTTLGNDLFVETDPGRRMSTLSLQIFGSATGGFVNAQNRAWAGALTLIAIVLLLTIIARLVARRSAVSR
ncbi:MAG: phosphate transport system permease protein [Gaiellales bacterium]|jgi:phosphate transport system permease protein|nr:phosphate transport system permease protein [Gaiellales bacterium]